MKNLFLALALTGFFGGVCMAQSSQTAQDTTKPAQCKKGGSCCQSKSTTANSTSKEGTMKCCSSSGTANAKPSKHQPKQDVKKVEAVK